MKTAFLIFTVLFAAPAAPQGGAGHFSKDGLAFDYPAGWALADTGDARSQRLTLTRAGGSNIIIVFAQRELITTAMQLYGSRSTMTMGAPPSASARAGDSKASRRRSAASPSR